MPFQAKPAILLRSLPCCGKPMPSCDEPRGSFHRARGIFPNKRLLLDTAFLHTKNFRDSKALLSRRDSISLPVATRSRPQFYWGSNSRGAGKRLSSSPIWPARRRLTANDNSPYNNEASDAGFRKERAKPWRRRIAPPMRSRANIPCRRLPCRALIFLNLQSILYYCQAKEFFQINSPR